MAIVVGHSQVKYLDNFTQCPVFSYPGYTVRDFFNESLDFYENVAKKSAIAIVVGANDIGRKTAVEIVGDIKELCFRLHAMSPLATVLVSEILPRGRNLFHVQTNDRICVETVFLNDWNAVAVEVNILLRDLSKSIGWLRTISQWEFHSIFGAVRRFLGRDGLHLSFEGTEKLANTLDAAISSVPIVMETAPKLAKTLDAAIGSMIQHLT